MTDASSAHSFKCPNCGAPLAFAPGQSSVRCRFCDSVIEHSSEALTADDHAHVIEAGASGGPVAGAPPGQARRFMIKSQNGQPVVIELGDQAGSAAPTIDQMYQAARSVPHPASVPKRSYAPPARRSSRSGWRVGALIAVITIVPLCIVVLATVPGAGGIFQALLSGHVQEALGRLTALGMNIQVGSSGTIVPGANDGPPEAILLTNQYPATSSHTTEHRLVAVSTTTSKLLWQSALLDANLYNAAILADAARVFTVSGQQVLAFNRTDGSTAWHAPLADKVSCLACVRLTGARLGVFSDDGTLEVFDAATGQSQWKVSAGQDRPRSLYVLGQRLAFMDRDAKSHGVLRAFDAATGKEGTAQPMCPGSFSSPDYADSSTPLWVAPTGSDFYLLVGICVQRWDTQNLQQVWSTALPKTTSPSFDNTPPLFSADSLYLPTGQTVLAFALNQGSVRTVVDDANYNFGWLAVHGSDVILQAKRQRGTSRYEIWSIDGTTGANHWKFDLGANPPLKFGSIIDDNEPVWFVQPSDAGLRVLHVKSAADNRSHSLLAETLDWQTGQTGGQKETQLGLPTIILNAPEWTLWKNDTLWMAIEQELVAFDAAQNKMIYRWP